MESDIDIMQRAAHDFDQINQFNLPSEAQKMEKEFDMTLPLFRRLSNLAKLGSAAEGLTDHSYFCVGIQQFPVVTLLVVEYVIAPERLSYKTEAQTNANGGYSHKISIQIVDGKALIDEDGHETELVSYTDDQVVEYVYEWAARQNPLLLRRASEILKPKNPKL